MTQKNTLLIVAAIGAAFLLSRNANAFGRVNVPGATPVIGSYNQSPAYAGQYGQPYSPYGPAFQQQHASAQSWGALGSALGNVFNKITGTDSTPAISAGSGYNAVNTAVWMNDGNPVGTAPDLGQYVPGSLEGMNNFYG